MHKLPSHIVKISQAKQIARKWYKWIGIYLETIPTKYTEKVPTMAVDNVGRLYVNPEFVEGLKVEEIAYVLLHEICHNLLDHAARRQRALAEPSDKALLVWNIAADLCVQQLLGNYDQHRPDGTVNIGDAMRDNPALSRNMSTERYFTLLFNSDDDHSDVYDEPIYQSREPQGDGEQGNPGEQGDDPSEQGSDQSGQSKSRPSDKPGTPRSVGGSSADGVPRDYEDKRDLASAGKNLAKLQEVRKELGDDPEIGRGTEAGQIKQALDNRLCPQPDPFDRLKSIVSQSMPSDVGTENWTYRKRGRLTECDDLPKAGVERLAPRCTIVVDTSGSMCCQERTTRAMTAIAQGCARVKKPRVIAWDASLADDKELTCHTQFDWSGCGGTDMSEAVEYAAKLTPRPDAIVLVTDGGTPWPQHRLPMPLIVALVADDGVPPDWAITVDLTKGGTTNVC